MKKIFLENLATKAMALLLAVLTWVYLFSQGNGTAEIQVEFTPPVLDPQVFASAVYRDAQHREIPPGDPLQVRLSGPKGDVRFLSLRPPKTFSCKFQVDPKLLDSPKGTVTISLETAYFGLPPAITVEPLPSAQVTLEYVKYLDREVDLIPNSEPWEGEPREGYKVDSVTVLPSRIKAKVPADGTGVDQVEIRTVPVAGRFESFTVERWELEPGSRIIAQTPFRAEVKVVAVPATRRLPLDVHLMTREENKGSVKIDSKKMTVEIQGPKELIDNAPESAFVVYVVVTDADAATPGPKNINLPQIGCHILDAKYRNVTVVLMPDLTVENRQVKISVDKK